MTEFREGWRGDKARKVVWNSSRLEEGFETHAKSLLPVTLCVQLRGGRHVDGSSTSKTGPSLGKLRDHHARRVEEQILTTKATTGAQSRDRAARPERGRTAGCRRQLGWYPRDQEAERRGRKMEGKEPRLGEKQEETFAGGEQREPGPTRVEGADGGGRGLGQHPDHRPSSQSYSGSSSQTDPTLDSQGLMKDGQTRVINQ